MALAARSARRPPDRNPHWVSARLLLFNLICLSLPADTAGSFFVVDSFILDGIKPGAKSHYARLRVNTMRAFVRFLLLLWLVQCASAIPPTATRRAPSKKIQPPNLILITLD